MNNYEHIKTGLLIGLICLSMVLTWQLWTYQPDIALLEDTTRLIPNEKISDEKKLTEVIQPEQMIIRKGDEHALIPPDDVRFDLLYRKLLGVNLNKSEMNIIEQPSKHIQNEGIEIIFPTAIPTDVFLGLFQVNSNEFQLPLTTIDRLLLYVDVQDEQIHMRIFSKEDQQVVDIEINLSKKEFERTYLASFAEYPKVIKVNNKPSRSIFTEDIYIPENAIHARKLSYTISPISGEFFRQSLFTDPESVKYYRQSDNEESYTDGNRIINIRTNGLFMEYNNPVFSEPKDRSSKHIVLRSYEFINGHGGWTNEYMLTDWESTEFRDEAEYRLHVNQYPVISFEGSDQMKLRVSRSGNQTESYLRPLFFLDSQPIDAKIDVELPSGPEVMEQLQKQEFFDIDRLQKVIVGYEMIMPNRSFVTVEPHWFVLYENRWQKVMFDEEEGGSHDGLG